jgi:hypothetical protein
MAKLIKLQFLIVLLFLNLAGASLRADAENTTLEFKGTPGISFLEFVALQSPTKKRKSKGFHPQKFKWMYIFQSVRSNEKPTRANSPFECFKGGEKF